MTERGWSGHLLVVITGLVPVIHVLVLLPKKDVDGRDIGAKQSFVASPGHDGLWTSTTTPNQKSRHHRACPGDPRSDFVTASRTRMAGTSARSKASSPRPAMTAYGHQRQTPNQKSRHHRPCPGDPCSGFVTARTWMAGTSARSKASSPRPAMTENRNKRTQPNAD